MKFNSEERATFLKFSDLVLPRHTSYPSAPYWQQKWTSVEAEAAFHRSASEGHDLSLYVHVPYCRKLCFYCACTKEIIFDDIREKRDPVVAYLDSLEVELAAVSRCYQAPTLRQLHFGGGTPTFLTPTQLDKIFSIIKKHFRFEQDAEIAIELDPRVTTLAHLDVLVAHGCNRVSLGVQDFDPEVQKTVNRIQSFEMVEALVEGIRSRAFAGLNFDLIYGLPGQTPASLEKTLSQVIQLRPDRIAFYRLAVIPEIFKWQRSFARKDLPIGEESLDLMLLALDRFSTAGYEFIGLDHFALPSDTLTQAMHDGTLQRTFQGMTTGGGIDVIGVGPSAISLLSDAFSQNIKSSQAWITAVAQGLPAERGMVLSSEDKLRQEILQSLYGWGEIEFKRFSEKAGRDFHEVFQDELVRLKDLENDGLVKITPDKISLTPRLGRLLVRVVASVFDSYIPKDAYRSGLTDGKGSRTG